jgi:hypothetical protein
MRKAAKAAGATRDNIITGLKPGANEKTDPDIFENTLNVKMDERRNGN